MKSLKKILAGLLCAAMSLALFPALPAKADYFWENDFRFNSRNELVAYRGTGGDIVLPERTVYILPNVFDGRAEITSVTCNAALEGIDCDAFTNMPNLQRIVFTGHRLNHVCDRAFKNDPALTSVSFTDPTLTYIPVATFYQENNITSITMPDSVVEIGSQAFAGCSKLKEITLPASLETCNFAFINCSSLEKMVFKNKNFQCLYSCPYPFPYEEYRNPNLTVYGYWGTCVSTRAKEAGLEFVSLGDAEQTFINPNDGQAYSWAEGDGCKSVKDMHFDDLYVTWGSGDGYEYDSKYYANYCDKVLYLNGEQVKNTFICDGRFTYYIQEDGTPMRNRLTYHPDGVHIIYFDQFGHEAFNAMQKVENDMQGNYVDALCYFDTFGYMYKNTVTYNESGSHLYYINPNGVVEKSGWFHFDPTAMYGCSGTVYPFTGTYMGYAYSDGTLAANRTEIDTLGNAHFLGASGEMVY